MVIQSTNNECVVPHGYKVYFCSQIRSMRPSPHCTLTRLSSALKPENLAISTQKRFYSFLVLGNFGCCFISDPQPDMAWNLFQAAICVQSVGVHVSCSSHVCTQLAAFFIDPRAEWSTTRGWYFYIFFCLYTLLHFHEKGMAHLPAPTFYIFRKTGREQHHRVSQDTTCERMCWNSNIFVPVHTLSNLFAVNTGFHAATTLVSHMSRRPHFYILDVAVNFTLSTADLCQDLLTP